MSGSQYDAIVVGAGHNGLVTAAYLAHAGWRVLVLERRCVVGGACVTESVFPGYRVSTAAYLVSLLQERVVRDLDLRRFGYEVFPKDPAYFAPLPDGRHLFMYADLARTCQEISKFSPRDAERYPAYEQSIERVARFIEPLLLHHMMGGVGGVRGLWGFLRGGMGALSEALASSARAAGAEIRVNADVDH